MKSDHNKERRSLLRIIGHGIDIVDVIEIERRISADPEAFIGWFHTRELLELNARGFQAPSVAGRIAAKEAVAKALQTGFTHNVSWQDIVVIATTEGVPEVELFLGASEVAARLGIERLLLSISHTRQHAVASVIAIGT